MSLFSASESQLDQAEALYATMHEDRVCPGDPASSHEALWGELRSVCERPLTGGEMWDEWRPLFEAFRQDQRDVMCHYMQERWTLPVTSFADLEQSFLFEVLRVNVEQFRAQKLPVIKPALGEQGMQAWEQQAGVRVPEPLRTFAVQVSAGEYFDGEFGMFDFSFFHEQMSTFGYAVEELSDDDPDTFFVDALNVLAGAIECFATSPKPMHECEGARAMANIPGNTDVARDALVVGWYFEGNHGDWTDLLITSGPLMGDVVRFDSLVHANGMWGEETLTRVPVMTWLRDQYYINCLTEDVWGELELDIDY